MTEADAKTKWCPMKKFERFKTETFVGTPEEAAIYSAGLKAARDKRALDMNCIGSACMMWESETKEKEHELKTYPLDTTEFAAPAGEGWSHENAPVKNEYNIISYMDGELLVAQHTKKLWAIRWSRDNPNPCGHCGLAGKP